MSPDVEWVTFDCYGTLIDWDGGIGSFLYAMALRSGQEAPPPGAVLRREWEDIQYELIQGPYQPYADVLASSLHRLCEKRDIPFTDADGQSMVASMRSWQPFHDTRPALQRAQEAGVKLAIISNTDHSIIAHSLNQLRIEFDEVITAEDCGAYKPASAVFHQAAERLQAPADKILHTAFGFKYDIGPAQSLGWKTAWINRDDDPAPADAKPDHIWRDLWGLAEFCAEDATS